MTRPFLLSALALAVLAGCASPQGIAPPGEQALAPAALLPTNATDTAPLSTRWWQALGDAQLDALVDQALAGNPSLRLAQARLAKARAQADLTDASTGPQVNAALDATHQRYTENGMVPAPLAGDIRDTATLQLNGAWELDFFGKHEAALQAALGQARAAQADADAARVLLSTQVVRTYLQLARAEAQQAVARRTLAQREHLLRLVQERVAAGLDSELERRQAEGAVPEARQQIEAWAEQAQLARLALAALVGQPGQAVASTAPDLQALRALPTPAVLPADLLGRRADVAAARWRVEAATQDAAQARAQFYPNVNLVGFVGLSSIGLNQLLDAGSLQWGVGPAIRLPLFDSGRLRAQLRGKNADVDAATASYNATLIDAVRQVSEQLASGQSVARQQAQQAQAQQAAEAALQIAQLRYEKGLGNYLQVLSTETQVLAQRRLAVDLQARALDAQASLAHALGGGWVPTTQATNDAATPVASARP